MTTTTETRTITVAHSPDLDEAFESTIHADYLKVIKVAKPR